MPAISVVIPVYNCAAYIQQTIGSVLAQSMQDFEIIVIDDGSTDETPALLQAMGGRVRTIRTHNGGVCRARNLGIRESRGRYVCLMDHDDYWFPHKLAQQANLLDGRQEVGVVYSHFINWHRDGAGFPPPSSFDLSQWPDEVDPAFSGWIYHQLLLDCWMLTSTAMFRRSVFDDCGTFDESLPFSEDWELWLRISHRHQFLKHSRPTTLYRQHPQQGNRKVREVDYRSDLLEASAARWGLCSQDGRCVPARTFKRQLARYRMEYGMSHIAARHRSAGIRSLWRAFVTDPGQVKLPIYMAAALLGWRPRW